MKILFISQYFYPENFRINDLVFSLNKRGHHIEVLTGKPNYPKGDYFKGYSWKGPSEEIINGIKVHRANLVTRKKGRGIRLLINYISFIFFGYFKLQKLKGSFDAIFVFASSPISVGYLGISAAKKFHCKSYLWVHDLWPESVRVAGGISNKLILRGLDKMTRNIYKGTDCILMQSPAFKSYLNKQDVPDTKLKYYPYYAEDFYKKVEEKDVIKKQFPEGFNLLFAGNIGDAQSFDTIIDAVEKIKKENVNVVVLGEGRDKKRVLDLIKIKKLEHKFYFLGSYPPEQMPEYFACADALLITLKKAGIFSYTIPGKLQSYLACSKPIIGSLDGIGNKIIKESKSGYVGDAENSEELASNILQLMSDDLTKKNDFSKNGLKYFNKHFKKEKLLQELEVILSEN